MISRIKGSVLRALPNKLEVWVSPGMALDCIIPISTYDSLMPVEGAQVELYTHLVFKETQQALFGFATEEEKELFLLLINRVSGVGPSVAMAILSGMRVIDFKQAVSQSDIATIATIKGLGKKTAERIIVELKDKIKVAEIWQAQSDAGAAGSIIQDAQAALIALGLKAADAQKAVQLAFKQNPEATVDELIRQSLR